MGAGAAGFDLVSLFQPAQQPAVGQRQVVRRHFCRHPHSTRACSSDQCDAAGCAHSADVQMSAGRFGESNIAGYNGLFGGRRDAR